MSGETLIAVVSLLVSGAISGLALWLTFGERRSSYRQTIYAKQVEAYTEIITAANKVVRLCETVIMAWPTVQSVVAAPWSGAHDVWAAASVGAAPGATTTPPHSSNDR